MGRIIGIDLGTTYSAVAVREDRPGIGIRTPACPGYTVLVDKNKRRITPSVVAEDESGQFVVGYPAKGRAGFSPEPIMFSKRWMGEDKTFQLNKQGAVRPEQAAAEVLRYLKKLAEDALGEPVTEAVITVPAYFTMRAKQMTEEAGRLANLRVAQIAQEPVAAALMYCANDERDPLRIMTYDLGGGTFDVAILEKREGTISSDSVLAFDGNRFLGGYNFDQRLAFWLMDQLNAQGYSLHLNLEQPKDRVIFAKLMIYAERAKIALSESSFYQFQQPATDITDHSGNQVVIDVEITREQFESMIEKEVSETIELCRRALNEKASKPLSIDDLDEIIMVGGSSRIPLISRRLTEAFGRKPQLVEPDLCVALGAAILAGTRAQAIGCIKLNPIPANTELLELIITGHLVPDGALTDVAGCVVTLNSLDGGYRSSRTVDGKGAFVFQSVPLAPEVKTEFALTVSSPSSQQIARHTFAVNQTTDPTAGGAVGEIGNVLSKPICILTADGVHEIVAVRTPLPHDTQVRARTTDTSGKIRIVILEENAPLGDLLMKDLPTTLAVGSEVDLTLTIQPNYQIHARAYIPSLAREGTVLIDIPMRAKKSLIELRGDFDTLAALADDAMRGASIGMNFGKSVRLRERLRAVDEMLRDRTAEPAAVQDCLDEIESLIRALKQGWRPEPAREIFNVTRANAEDLLARAIQRKPEIAQDGYDRQLEAIRAEAEDAYRREDTAAWKDSFNRLAKLCDNLKAVAETRSGGGGGDDSPRPAEILLSLGKELGSLELYARELGRYDEFKSEFSSLEDDLKRIDPGADDAMTRINDWYFTRFKNLQRRLNAPDDEGLLRLDSLLKV